MGQTTTLVVFVCLSLISTVLSQGSSEACACPFHYDPVCGIDGKTYGNDCRRRCAGVPLAYRGECGTVQCNQCLDVPCSVTSCPIFPFAVCRNDCLNCRARYFASGQEVTQFC